ncbi:MAG TPA: ABC transporter ATP-binding protein [Candidatus Cybelea sp.]|jgi:ABC-2 type transport system ATP-binding protein|nr:ABC transporter ATP-binding protein [Candidatus Cybelea sp.]
MESALLTFDRVTKSYGEGRALDELSFRVCRDEIVALLGPNGAGKTTTIEIALGLRGPDAGAAVLIGGSARNVAIRRRLGVTPQESGFPDMLRVEEILAFVASHYSKPAPIRETLARFGLETLAKRRAGTLSGGESRRLALALAFVGNPELVVLDEPTTGLDVESRRRLWSAVRDLGAGRSILFTTHYLEEAQELATRIIVIDRGRMLFDGMPQSLRERVGGRRLTYVGSDGPVAVTTNDADQYVRTMVAGGVAFSELEIVRPSLEEAFLSLTGGNR